MPLLYKYYHKLLLWQEPKKFPGHQCVKFLLEYKGIFAEWWKYLSVQLGWIFVRPAQMKTNHCHLYKVSCISKSQIKSDVLDLMDKEL